MASRDELDLNAVSIPPGFKEAIAKKIKKQHKFASKDNTSEAAVAGLLRESTLRGINGYMATLAAHKPPGYPEIEKFAVDYAAAVKAGLPSLELGRHGSGQGQA